MSNRRKTNSAGLKFNRREEWEQIQHGRDLAEKNRQLRAERLGRKTHAMPGYEQYVERSLGDSK